MKEKKHMDIEQDLKALGDTTDQIADTLQGLGIKGHREQSYGCPIYRYLQSKGHAIGSVGYHYISIVAQSSFYMPSLITDFIRSFDHGKYPDLETK
jgi:hypothetical protein